MLSERTRLKLVALVVLVALCASGYYLATARSTFVTSVFVVSLIAEIALGLSLALTKGIGDDDDDHEHDHDSF